MLVVWGRASCSASLGVGAACHAVQQDALQSTDPDASSFASYRPSDLTFHVRTVLHVIPLQMQVLCGGGGAAVQPGDVAHGDG